MKGKSGANAPLKMERRTTMFKFRSVQGWLMKLAGGLMAVTMLAGVALAPTYAAGSPNTGTPPAATVLTNLYQREQKWLSAQTTTLTDANTIAANMQNMINTLKGQKKVTSGLESALAAFQGQIAVAQTAHDRAADILSTHAGFDANGQVTDRDQAVNTVRQAFQSLLSAHQTLSSAAAKLREGIRDFHQANG
jgi:hypothetical protein